MAIRFAIIGSGPAGFFSLKSLFKHIPDCKVDMFERFPVPFGLIRYGVAPDHSEIKNIITDFTELAMNSNFRYFGNVNVVL
jgi:NADPH-dependent glutamate synthase beta subunit-like oxidoreductase